MPKFDLPQGTFIDVRFTFGEAYDKVSEKGNVTVAPESGFAEVIGHSDGLASVAATFGRYGAERGKIAFFVQPKGLKAPAKAPAKRKATAKPKAEAAAPDIQALIATEIAKALANLK
jgi:hypothetical protein